MKMKEKAIPKQLIRVVYPIDGGKIMLRTAENWNANIEAHSVRLDGCLSEFQIETDRPYSISNRLELKSMRATV